MPHNNTTIFCLILWWWWCIENGLLKTQVQGHKWQFQNHKPSINASVIHPPHELSNLETMLHRNIWSIGWYHNPQSHYQISLFCDAISRSKMSFFKNTFSDINRRREINYTITRSGTIMRKMTIEKAVKRIQSWQHGNAEDGIHGHQQGWEEKLTTSVQRCWRSWDFHTAPLGEEKSTKLEGK